MFSGFNFLGKKTVVEKSEVKPKGAVFDVENIDDVVLFFKTETGVSFENQKGVLKSKLTTFCRNNEIDSIGTLLGGIKTDSALKQKLIDYLTTNESFFYREFEQVEKLVSLVKNSDFKVDILCAPCASGEEPYSIIIALLEASVSRDRFRVVGIDINQSAIDKALVGIYGKRSVKNLSVALLEKYFESENEKYKIKRGIKDSVDFKKVNIFEDELFRLGKFDYIFSRNMFIYFDKETKKKAKERLESLLKSPQNPIFFGHADMF